MESTENCTSEEEAPRKMAATCDKHPFDEATDTCQTCGYDFCPDCLVYPKGDSKPPFCVPCALAASGVRSTAGRRPKSFAIATSGRASVLVAGLVAVAGAVGALSVL